MEANKPTQPSPAPVNPLHWFVYTEVRGLRAELYNDDTYVTTIYAESLEDLIEKQFETEQEFKNGNL